MQQHPDNTTIETPSALDGATALALMKLLDTNKVDYRNKLRPGTYEVDECVGFRVFATVKVGEDYTQRIAHKARPWALVSILLEELQQHTMAAGRTGVDLERLVKAAIALDPKVEKEAQERADKIAAALKADTLTPCKGKVTISGSLETIL